MKVYLNGQCVAWLLAGATLIATVSAAEPSAMSFRSAENRTPLVELYTSEGCSSCPPAESWLSRLTNSPGLWRDFVPVAFHVDYWDYLGWRDPWGSKEFSNRQRSYAAAWNSGSIYTPGFVLNGREWRDWSRVESVPQSRTRTGILEASTTDLERWQVEFRPIGVKALRCEIHFALLENGLFADVRAGENRGRRLAHDFVATTLIAAPMRIENGILHAEVVTPKRPIAGHGRPAIAIWVSAEGEFEPLQAVGGWLTPPPVK